jgi:hypothetical protein
MVLGKERRGNEQPCRQKAHKGADSVRHAVSFEINEIYSISRTGFLNRDLQLRQIIPFKASPLSLLAIT